MGRFEGHTSSIMTTHTFLLIHFCLVSSLASAYSGSGSGDSILIPRTFFTKTTNFGDVSIKQSWPYINCQQFVAASENYLSVFDVLGNSFSAHLRQDAELNILTLKQYCQTKNEDNLLRLIYQERNVRNKAATRALLWLKRGLWMFHHFFSSVVESRGRGDGKAALQEAYQQKLAKYHNFVVKQVVSRFLKRFGPDFSEFARAVCFYQVKNDPNPGDHCRSKSVTWRNIIVLDELEEYIDPMGQILTKIDKFYAATYPELN